MDAFVLNDTERAGLGVHIDAFGLELFEGIGGHVLDFYREHVLALAKGEHRVVIGKASLGKVRRHASARSIGRRVEDVEAHIDVGSGLQEHTAELTAAQHTELEFRMVDRIHGAQRY